MGDMPGSVKVYTCRTTCRACVRRAQGGGGGISFIEGTAMITDCNIHDNGAGFVRSLAASNCARALSWKFLPSPRCECLKPCVRNKAQLRELEDASQRNGTDGSRLISYYQRVPMRIASPEADGTVLGL